MLINLDGTKTDGEIIENKKFTDFQMSERNHLQEVIAKNPEVLGEDLLIISKEFSNWENTSERLDLLALDKNQNLVVIENKLDDSGKDVTWQILKYASYVSTLTKDDIIDIYKKYLGDDERTEQELLGFFEIEDLDELDLENEKGTQRLLMVANNFRSEIISATMWMIDNGIQVKCVEVKPYEVGQEKVLNFEQIIPVKDMEEYLVKVALKTKTNAIEKQNKNMTELDKKRMKFWKTFLEKSNNDNSIFSGRTGTKSHYLSTGFYKDTSLVEVVLKRNKKMWSELSIKEKQLFDFIYSQKEKIEKEHGLKFLWERLDDKKISKIIFEDKFDSDNIFDDEEKWDEVMDFLIYGIKKIKEIFEPYIKDYYKKD